MNVVPELAERHRIRSRFTGLRARQECVLEEAWEETVLERQDDVGEVNQHAVGRATIGAQAKARRAPGPAAIRLVALSPAWL